VKNEDLSTQGCVVQDDEVVARVKVAKVGVGGDSERLMALLWWLSRASAAFSVSCCARVPDAHLVRGHLIGSLCRKGEVTHAVREVNMPTLPRAHQDRQSSWR
jgi:hypothetical protein